MDYELLLSSSASVSDLLKDIEMMEQIETPSFHHFSDGLYTRETHMAKGTFAIGKIHKNRVTNILLKGKISVYMGDKVELFEAPCIFISEPMVSKIAYFHEDTVWLNCHPTLETDLDKIELEVIIPFENNQVIGAK